MTDTNGDNGNSDKNGPLMDHDSEENLDLENPEPEEEEDEEASIEDFIAGFLNEIFESGLPIRFFAHTADPFVQPVLKRMEMNNAVLADIAKSLRVLAKRDENAPFDVSIQLKKKSVAT